MIPTLYVMCGIQGSGKSTTAKELQDESGAFLLSSDQIRLELYGSEADQTDNAKIFQTLYHRARFYLNQGSDVIIDAMNISRKRRIYMLTTEFRNIHCKKEILYMATPINKCVENDGGRDRTLGKSIILNTSKQMEVPIYSEGWDVISYVQPEEFTFKWRELVDDLDRDIVGESEFSNIVGKHMPWFEDLFNIDQCNPHHTLTIGGHTFETFRQVKRLARESEEQYDGYNYAVLMLSAIFHDVGKVQTMCFKDAYGKPSEFAHFYRHENVSAQIAVTELTKLNLPSTVIDDIVELVLFHMSLYLTPKKNGKRKVESLISEENYKMLLLLNEADRLAH